MSHWPLFYVSVCVCGSIDTKHHDLCAPLHYSGHSEHCMVSSSRYRYHRSGHIQAHVPYNNGTTTGIKIMIIII